MSERTSDKEYYTNYYNDKGEYAYLGENMKTSSRMLVFQDWLRSYLKPGAKVLDIGCGDAIFAKLMPEFEWHGVDINIDKAIERIPYQVDQEKSHLVAHDLMQTPYPWPTGHFDAIICSEVLEHLWDLRIVHKEAKRLLKRDGVYIVSTPNFDWIQNHLEHYRRILSIAENHWTFEHIRHYNFDVHKKYLNEVGFVIERHQGADEMYCPVFANVANAIQLGLRERGIDISTPELGVLIGKGVPHYQHTVIVSARKA